jgi:hypothetical protein
MVIGIWDSCKAWVTFTAKSVPKERWQRTLAFHPNTTAWTVCKVVSMNL